MRPLALLAAAPALVGGLNTPMNSRPYTISPVSAAKTNPEAKAPPFRGEWFEVYGHWQNTTYSQVDWHGDPVPLPADIVKRFDGKVMAVVGFESTLVRQSATGAEELVPTTQLYNHHYSGSMSGKHAKRAAWPEGVTPIRGTHGNVLPYYELDESGSTLRQPSGERFPFIQSFSEGNGNEHRNSFKGYAKGFAQIIESPTEWSNSAMIINTNKELTGDKSPGPIGGPVPRMSLAPEGADYQSVLECPCTSRKVKLMAKYHPLSSGRCPATRSVEARDTTVKSIAECAHASSFLAGPEKKATCNVTGTWFNPGNKIYVDMKQDGAHFTASCEGSVGWKGATGTVGPPSAKAPQGVITLHHGQDTEYASFQPSEAMAGAPACTQLTFRGGSVAGAPTGATWCRKGFCGGDAKKKPAPQVATVDSESLPGGCYMSDKKVLTYNHNWESKASCDGHECLCRDASVNAGTIAGGGGGWDKNVCAPFPVGELLTTHNSICNISEYEGGLSCCADKSILLDEDQDISHFKVDHWRLKYRFYYEEYTQQLNSFRVWWSTEAWNNEFDVPKSTADCLDPKTPAEECTHIIKSNFTGQQFLEAQCMTSDPLSCGNATKIREEHGGWWQLTYAAFHCHAPACMSGE